jgi:hypothetical protein
MTLAIEEVLAVWRDVERVRDALPPAHPGRADLDADIVQLRAIYARMTDLIASSNQDLRASADQIACAMETLERVRTRLGAPGPIGGLLVEPAEG